MYFQNNVGVFGTSFCIQSIASSRTKNNRSIALQLHVMAMQNKKKWISVLLTDGVNSITKRSTCNTQAVSCSVRAPTECSYRWIDVVTEEILSEVRELDLKQVRETTYKYQCQIVCRVRGQLCAFDYDQVFCRGKDRDRWLPSLLLTIILMASRL